MAYDSVGAARTDIAQYFGWYNTKRPHSSLDRLTPKQGCENLLPKLAEVAKMKSLVRPDLPTAAVGSSQATTAAVDNSAPLAIRLEST